MADTSIHQAKDSSSQQPTKRSNAKKDASSNGKSNSTAVAMADPSSWWKRALAAAFKGGISGSIAMVLQVVLLMWLRTTINYQYKHGVDTATAFARLYADGGIFRFYQGAAVALLTGPISRFGDTAANEGIKELLSRYKLPVWAVTFLASATAAAWRIVITPLDTIKTTLQVTGGWGTIAAKIQKNRLSLWDGALGNSAATLFGHYPWFVVHNFLDARLPRPTAHRQKLLRRAFIGFCSSFVSDCVSNGVRVLKTYKQTSPVSLTYGEALSELLEANGPAFVVRGLGLKIVSNGMSGILFAVVWKMVLERINNNSKPKDGDHDPKSLDDGEKSKQA